MVLLRALGLLLVPALLGHLFYRAFAPPREDTPWGEVLFFQLFSGVLFCGWPALLLAELGWFSLGRWLLLLAVLCAAVLAWRWPHVRRWHGPRFRVERSGALTLVLFLAAAALLCWPGERILGGNDPGVYVSTAAAIARTGGIVQYDPLLARVPSELRPALFSSYIGQSWQLPGFYVTDWARGEVTPQFLQLFPSWLALFYAAGGLELLLGALPLFSLLGLAAVYFLTRRLVGPWAAPVALALLALNPAAIWFAREPMAEPLTMALLIGGWLLLQRFLETGRRDLAVLAGIALGQVGLAKLEFFFLPLLLYGFFFLRSTHSPLRAAEKAFLWAYTLLWGHALLHGFLISRPYLRTFATSLGASRLALLSAPGLWIMGVGVALAVLALLAFRRRLGAAATWLAGQSDRLRQGGVVLWLALAGYGAVVWPALAPRWIEVEGELLYHYERLTFSRLSWYLSLPGLLLAVVGVAWWVRRRLTGPSVPFFLAMLLQVVLYIHRAMDYPYHFWMMRRYLPLILPVLTMGMAAAIWRLRQVPLGPALRRGASALLLGLLLTQLVWVDAAFAGRRELAGLRAALAELAERVPDGRPLFVGTLAPALATPLRYVEGEAAYALPEPAPWRAVWELLEGWPGGQSPVYLLLNAPPELLRSGFSLVESGSWTLDVSGTEESLGHLPRDAVRIQAALRLLQVQHLPQSPLLLELRLDTPIWTGSCLTLSLPASAKPLLLQLEAAGYRPESVPPARLAVQWDGVPVADQPLERTWQVRPITLQLAPPPGWTPSAEELHLELCVGTWNPREVGYSDDGRDLGLLLQSLTVEQR